MMLSRLFLMISRPSMSSQSLCWWRRERTVKQFSQISQFSHCRQWQRLFLMGEALQMSHSQSLKTYSSGLLWMLRWVTIWLLTVEKEQGTTVGRNSSSFSSLGTSMEVSMSMFTTDSSMRRPFFFTSRCVRSSPSMGMSWLLASLLSGSTLILEKRSSTAWPQLPRRYSSRGAASCSSSSSGIMMLGASSSSKLSWWSKMTRLSCTFTRDRGLEGVGCVISLQEAEGLAVIRSLLACGTALRSSLWAGSWMKTASREHSGQRKYWLPSASQLRQAMQHSSMKWLQLWHFTSSSEESMQFDASSDSSSSEIFFIVTGFEISRTEILSSPRLSNSWEAGCECFLRSWQCAQRRKPGQRAQENMRLPSPSRRQLLHSRIVSSRQLNDSSWMLRWLPQSSGRDARWWGWGAVRWGRRAVRRRSRMAARPLEAGTYSAPSHSGQTVASPLRTLTSRLVPKQRQHLQAWCCAGWANRSSSALMASKRSLSEAQFAMSLGKVRKAGKWLRGQIGLSPPISASEYSIDSDMSTQSCWNSMLLPVFILFYQIMLEPHSMRTAAFTSQTARSSPPAPALSPSGPLYPYDFSRFPPTKHFRLSLPKLGSACPSFPSRMRWRSPKSKCDNNIFHDNKAVNREHPPQAEAARGVDLPEEDLRATQRARERGDRAVGGQRDRVRGGRRGGLLQGDPAPLLQAQQLLLLRPPAQHVQLPQDSREQRRELLPPPQLRQGQ